MKHRLQIFVNRKLSILFIACASLGFSNMLFASSNAIHGNFSGSWVSYNLDSNGEVIINMSAGNYEFGIKYNNNDTWYAKNHTFTESFTDWDFETGAVNAKLNTSESGNYKFKVKDNDGKPRLSVTFPSSDPTAYSLGGYINGADKTSYDSNSSFAFVSQGSNVWTLTRNFSTSTQYFQVYDDAGNCYGRNSAGGGSGSPQTLIKNDCGYTKVSASVTTGVDYTITWNSSTKQISWALACTPPEASNFTVASNTYTYEYDGNPHSATVTGVSPYSPDNIVAYYGANSSTTATSQTNADAYYIYVHSADAYGSYCAVTSTITTALATQLVISPVTPSLSNYSDLFSITGTGTHAYTGVAQSVAVAWKSPYTGCKGAITVKYNNSTDAPTNVGTYPITISVAAGTNNNASASDISVGTLTITAISPGLALGDISNKCGTGDYALSSTSNSAGAVTYSVTSGNATIVNGTTLRVNATGDVTVQASQVANGNYTAQVVSRTYSFAAAPVAGFSASAGSLTLNFNNTADVSTTLSTAANSNWDFQWVCDSHPTWGSNNTPTIVSTTSNSTEVRFPIEGVYTFHVGAKCKKDYSYVNSTTVTVTVSLPLCIKGPLTNNTGSWNSYTLISNISNSNTRTYGFTAYNLGKNIREFVLDASPSGDGDNHHIHTSSTVGSLSLTGLDYNSGNNYNLRALEALGISSSGTSVLLTITHNGGLSYNISLVLNCTTPETKDISISESPVCQGESVNVVVESSQDGYIYTVYDSNNSTAGSGTGTGSDLNISVTPSAGTTYTVKAKQADACLETSMANTVDISVNERPSFTPSTGITQYAPVTVTSTALSPSWSIASKDPDVDAAWISTTSGSSTVLKAPTGTYTVSDGGPCPTNAIVVSNDTEICN